MILNTGSRTDIPAYFSDWFYKRIEEGYVMVRNPYYPEQVTRYVLDPSVVDALVFCTKNPQPMLGRLEHLSAYDMFWFVTITPYDREIEPFVPPKEDVIRSFIELSDMVGKERMSWRYDPVFITEKYSVEYHIACFAEMAEKLRGYTGQCVVSFLDLYEKTKRNFREAREVTKAEQERIIEAFAGIAGANGMQINLCCENQALVRPNVDADGCLSQRVLEQAIGCGLQVPKKKAAREACSCLLGADIGVYNTCGHGCLYCYANYDRKSVEENRKRHDVNSPLLIGHLRETDFVKEAQQKSFKDAQMRLFL
ncbi:DUF1848 domain-containing protein [Suilimivivens sp.]|uniref:DUF1848 domain-containing protein n=1 Tax=Suilimivivens sp. TaxID=2981669 RepID=UPI0030782679